MSTCTIETEKRAQSEPLFFSLWGSSVIMTSILIPNHNPPGGMELKPRKVREIKAPKSRIDQERDVSPEAKKSVCSKHGRAYVVGIGCPYCE
jgi:hypothetical protein